ncbi:MAG: S41 family peptidase [Anaerolineae bacterium]|nr:S41 family peptidase [Anaerolineae bacterium]
MRILTSNPTRSMVGAVARGVLVGLGIGVVFVAGFLFRGAMPGVSAGLPLLATPDSEVGSYPLLAEVQNRLNQNYLRDQPAQKQLEYAAIRGLLSALNDKYTFFVDPPVARSESNVLAGKYGGIGVQVKRDDKGNFVLYPFRDGPAAKVGVQDGDMLLQVDGKDVPLSTGQDAVDQMLRGEVKNDNGVIIRVRRDPPGEEKEFKIVFAEIEVPSVVWRTLSEEPTFGYIQIMRFTSRTPDELKTAVADLRSKNITALVLDLRNNPGGLLQESITVAGHFLGGGVVLYERTREGEKTYEAPPGGVITDLPTVVLVNQGTASAAELVAGALKDRKRAILIGQQTYGKGSVQLIFSLGDQSSLHVTTAEWFPPSKTPLDGKGIAPDIAMIPDENGRDVEIGEAIRYLRDRKS